MNFIGSLMNGASRMNMPGLSNLSGGLNMNISMGLNTGDSCGLSSDLSDKWGGGNSLLSSLNGGNQSFSGMGCGMGMVPGFGSSCNAMGSMFGGMMQMMQQQQQMMQMMMMMMMMMQMMQQQQFSGMGNNCSSGTGGIGNSGTGSVPGAGGASGAPSSSAAPSQNSSIAPSQTNEEAINKLKSLGMSNSSISKVKQLKPEMQIKVAQLYEFAKSKGINFDITSGLRTYEQQQKLYQESLAKKDSRGGKMGAAKPGSSRHESGLAIDISGNESQRKILGDYWKSIGGTWGGDWGGSGSSTIKETWHFDLRK